MPQSEFQGLSTMFTSETTHRPGRRARSAAPRDERPWWLLLPAGLGTRLCVRPKAQECTDLRKSVFLPGAVHPMVKSPYLTNKFVGARRPQTRPSN